MRSMVIQLFVLVLGLLLLALASGFAGRWHPAGDSLAVFRLQFAVAALLVALVLAVLAPQGWRFALAALVVLGLVLPAASGYAGLGVEPGNGTVSGSALRLYQKNMNYLTADVEHIAADIRASGADVVTLQEVSPRNRALMALLAGDYPSQAFCPRRGVGGMAVLSRLSLAGDEGAVCGSGLTALRLMGPRGAFWAVSVHLFWPWPYRQAEEAAALAGVLAGLDGPVLVGGDFNMVPWGASVRGMARAAGAHVAGPTRTTFTALGRLFPLPIDQVLLPEGWQGANTLRPELGSDHRGLLTDISLPGGQAPASR